MDSPARRCLECAARSRRGEVDASFRIFPAAAARESERGADRLAPADAARRDDPPVERRHLFLAAARAARPEKSRADRARGAGPRRCAGDPDADGAAGRAVARERALRRLRQGDAAHPRPARPRDAVRADQRGAGDRDRPRLDQELSRPAETALPHPVEIPRRGAAALWRHARARVPDEGRLQLRPRRRRRRSAPTTRCSSPICGPSPGWG